MVGKTSAGRQLTLHGMFRPGTIGVWFTNLIISRALCCSLRASLACSGCNIMGMLPRLKRFILLCRLSRALCICHHCLPSLTGTMARKLSATAWGRCSEPVTCLGCSLAIEWIALPTHQQCMPFTRYCRILATLTSLCTRRSWVLCVHHQTFASGYNRPVLSHSTFVQSTSLLIVHAESVQDGQVSLCAVARARWRLLCCARFDSCACSAWTRSQQSRTLERTQDRIG